MGSSALTSPTLLAKKRLAVLNASNNFGHTSRRTISRTPKTNNSSTPTRKWQRFLEATASVPSVWPSSFPLTCLKLLSNLYISTPSFMEPKRHLGYGLASTRTEFFNIFKFKKLLKKNFNKIPKHRQLFFIMMNKTIMYLKNFCLQISDGCRNKNMSERCMGQKKINFNHLFVILHPTYTHE